MNILLIILLMFAVYIVISFINIDIQKTVLLKTKGSIFGIKRKFFESNKRYEKRTMKQMDHIFNSPRAFTLDAFHWILAKRGIEKELVSIGNFGVSIKKCSEQKLIYDILIKELPILTRIEMEE